MKKTKILAIILLILCIMVVIFNSFIDIFSIEVNESDIYNNDLISIFVDYDGNGNYEPLDDSIVDIDSYTFNEDDSYCENDSDLTYEDGYLQINLKGSTSCYLYFDKSLRNSIINESGTLKEAILLQNYFDETGEIGDLETATTYLDNKDAPNFNIIASTDEGMYAAEDDYGTSYYFRGDVEDNWVYFAGFYWQIVRIDGEGNIKIIYAGTNPTSISDDSIASVYLNVESDAVGKFVGYTYSNNDQYEVSEGDSIDSEAKEIIDKWYEDNLLVNYSSYFADVIWCNDRSSYKRSGTSGSYTYTKSSYGDYYVVYYGAYTRLYYDSGIDANPSYECPTQNDAYTVDDEENGNGLLDYPIALITADEYFYAGSGYLEDFEALNTNFYLRSINTLTLSPYYWYENNGINFIIGSSGYLNYNNCSNCEYKLRVVVSLKNDVVVLSGTGSSSDPYIIG